MATKKTTTAKKRTTTKTKKSPVKKTTRAASTKTKSVKAKSTTKKSNTKSASKTVDTKSSSVTAKTKSTTSVALSKLKSWNGVLAVLYGAAAAAIVAYGATVTKSVTVSYLTQDTIASGPESTVLAQATRALFSVNVSYMVAAVLTIAAVMHLLESTVLRKKYEAYVVDGVNRLRWIGHGIADGLLVTTVGLIAGVSNIAALFAIFAFVFVASVGVIMADGHVKHSHKTGLLQFAAIKAVVLTPWLIIASYVLGTAKYSDAAVGMGDTYLLVVSTFVLSLGYMMVERARYKKLDFVSDYMNVEWAYMIVGFALKAAFAGLVYTIVLQ